MRIAILGTRGIPARYGGFETFAEELSTRLGAQGHQVAVHCRKYLYPDLPASESGNIRRVLLPCIRTKHLETLTHTMFSVLHLWAEAARKRELPETVIICNAANACLIPLIRMLGIPVAINVDGIERERAKWGRAGSLWYRFGEWCAARFGTCVVSDAEVIRNYYAGAYRVESEVIAYGYNEIEEEEVEKRLYATPSPALIDRLARHDVTPGRFILYVSRLEPENNAHVVLEAYRLLSRDHPDVAAAYPLIMVGNAPYAGEYISALHKAAVENVRFLGFQFGEIYRALQLGAAVYIQATEVGGTHPALVEAMGFGGCIVANQTPENTEVLGDAGRYYAKNDAADLAAKLHALLTSERSKLMLQARERALEKYSWKRVVLQYEALCANLQKRRFGSKALDR